MKIEKDMRCVLVSSRLTFVPGNYDEFILGLLRNSQVVGFVELNNLSFSLVLKSFALMLAGAPRMGFQLFKNCFVAYRNKRKQLVLQQNRIYKSFSSMNEKEAIEFVKENQIDVVINARTRCIYKKQALEAPKLACINIHHGLLPHQRGIMCDLWALSENQKSGFTVHLMNEKIDGGDILVGIETPFNNDYLQYLKHLTSIELETINQLLSKIGYEGIVTRKNSLDTAIKHRKTPTFKEIKEIRNKGIKL